MLAVFFLSIFHKAVRTEIISEDNLRSIYFEGRESNQIFHSEKIEIVKIQMLVEEFIDKMNEINKEGF